MQLHPAQPRLRWASVLLLLPVLARSRDVSTRRFLEDPAADPPPIVTYDKMPGTPSEEMVVEQYEAAKATLSWQGNAESTSALNAASAENMEDSAKSALIAKFQGLKLRAATMQAILSAQKATEMRKRTQASVKRAERMVSDMPAIAMNAAKRAVDGVVAGAIQRMNIEATLVAEEQRKIELKLQAEAAKAAQLAALPWNQAKMRAGQTMISYSAQGRDLANAVTQLKNQAPKLAAQATVLQARGDVVKAQEFMIGAHDLLDKAGQLQGQAENFNKIANKINNAMGMYDLSAQAAAAYAAYNANPGGGVGYGDIPPPPKPLRFLPPDGGPGPAPAPGPAGGPAGGPAAGPAPTFATAR